MVNDPERTNPAAQSFFVHGYSAWAPTGLLGDTSIAGGVSLALGLASLLLTALSTMPFVAWLAAVLGIAFGLSILLPRATTAHRVASGVGMATALIAIGLLLS
jgi:hypothetical protein